MKVLVTGGAGFLGSHVAEECLRAGDEVVVFDDLSTGRAANVPDGALLVRGSVADAAAVDALFAAHRFAVVYHLAAYPAEVLSHHVRRFNYVNNVVGSANLINAAVRGSLAHFVYTSSVAVYGGAAGAQPETAHPTPRDPYGIGKLAVELDLAAAADLFGLSYTVLRPHNIYGERQHLADPYRNVVGIFMNQVLEGRPMTVFGDGAQTRAFTYVGDVAPVIVRAATEPGARNQVFNVGSGTCHTVLEVAREVAAALGVEPRFERLEARHEALHVEVEHAKQDRVFGPCDRTPLREGIARAAAWARGAWPLPRPTLPEIEVDRALPPSWRPA